MITAYLALGSNLEDPILQIKNAIRELSSIPNSRFLKASQLYRNPPVGCLDQPDFINAVAAIETELSSDDLLDYLFSVENKHQRVRVHKNGPRTLDLDLLLYGNEIRQSEQLVIPHPRLKERPFVIYPLYEIAPFLILPCGTAIKDLVNTLSREHLELITDQG